MQIFLMVVSLIELISGGMIAVSQSPTQQIIGTLLVGFGFLTMALTAILNTLQRRLK